MGLDESTPLNPATTPAISKEFGNFRVMVVDNSRTLRRILRQKLNSLGITHIVQAGCEVCRRMRYRAVAPRPKPESQDVDHSNAEAI